VRFSFSASPGNVNTISISLNTARSSVGTARPSVRGDTSGSKSKIRGRIAGGCMIFRRFNCLRFSPRDETRVDLIGAGPSGQVLGLDAGVGRCSKSYKSWSCFEQILHPGTTSSTLRHTPANLLLSLATMSAVDKSQVQQADQLARTAQISQNVRHAVRAALPAPPEQFFTLMTPGKVIDFEVSRPQRCTTWRS